jgi:hypothetical protein
MSEWKNKRDLVVMMTPEEQQSRQQQNPAAMKQQADAALLNQKQEGDLQLEDKKIAGRIATQTIKDTHQASIQSPLERAAAFAERVRDEREMQNSQYFAPTGGG